MLFTEDMERALYSEFIKAGDEMKIFFREQQYRQFLQRFALLQQYIDNFFDGVMVMINDEKIKGNRLALLRNIAGLITPVADLTKIVD